MLLAQLVFAALFVCYGVGNLVDVFSWSLLSILDLPNSQKVCITISFHILVVCISTT